MVGQDVLVIVAMSALALLVRGYLPVNELDAGDAYVSGAVLGVVWLAQLHLLGTYRRRRLMVGYTEYSLVLRASAAAAGTIAGLAYLFQLPIPRGHFVLALLFGTPALLLGRFLMRRHAHRHHRRGNLLTPVLVAGGAHQVADVVKMLRRESWLGYQPVGMLSTGGTGDLSLPVLGTPEVALDAVKRVGAGAVIFAEGSFSDGGAFNRLAREFENHPADMIVVPALTDISARRMRVSPVGGIPLVVVEAPRTREAGRWAKRAFDLVGSALLIIAAAPVMALTALAIKLEDGGPVLFRQRRVGRHGDTFDMLKFRSMYTDAEARKAELLAQNEGAGVLFKMANDPRITRVGRFIRRFSIDEIPQFLNVWRGEMSLVGPRPALPSEVACYEQHVHRRLDVRPGITGLWQVSGRSDLSWEDTVRLDIYYVDNWSMMQDVAIVLRTWQAVLKGSGAY